MTTKIDTRPASLLLPVGGVVDLRSLGRQALGVAPTPRDRKRVREAHERRQARHEFEAGAAIVAFCLAEHLGHSREQAACNISLVTGSKVTARQLEVWAKKFRDLLPNVGSFDQGAAHALRDAGEKVDCAQAKMLRLKTWRAQAEYERAQAHYLRVRERRYPNYEPAANEVTAAEHERAADLVDALADELGHRPSTREQQLATIKKQVADGTLRIRQATPEELRTGIASAYSSPAT